MVLPGFMNRIATVKDRNPFGRIQMRTAPPRDSLLNALLRPRHTRSVTKACHSCLMPLSPWVTSAPQHKQFTESNILRPSLMLRLNALQSWESLRACNQFMGLGILALIE